MPDWEAVDSFETRDSANYDKEKAKEQSGLEYNVHNTRSEKNEQEGKPNYVRMLPPVLRCCFTFGDFRVFYIFPSR